ncbi:MAG TPA: type II toxin-antitoxin system Phd/YefM family antitoxin [Gammaproteobacteria bacterium]|nr:type II toxin-antitoxin system Phd/YefM family antitoxin [Gammaproteobacteria bacterium]
MTTFNTIDAKEQFIELVNRVAHNKEQIILTRRGKEIAAIIPIEELNLLLESQNKQDLREAIDALKEARNIGTITLEQLKEDLGS